MIIPELQHLYHVTLIIPLLILLSKDERDHFRLELKRHKRQRIVGRRPAWEDDDDELER